MLFDANISTHMAVNRGAGVEHSESKSGSSNSGQSLNNTRDISYGILPTHASGVQQTDSFAAHAVP